MRHEIRVPDLEDFDAVEVIELLMEPGDSVAVDDSILTIESDKAAMEIPSPVSGKIAEILVRIGEQVTEGHLLAVVESVKDEDIQLEKTPVASSETPAQSAPPEAPLQKPEPKPGTPPRPALPKTTPPTETRKPHASPSVRRFARELNVDLAQVSGSGSKKRILKEDVKSFVNAMLSHQKPAPYPASEKQIDFSRFGEIKTLKLKRIQRVTATKMKQAWLTIPHVTQHDEADVEALETLRKSMQAKAEQERLKLTVLPFLIKALAMTATVFPKFLSSLNEATMTLTMKQYCHIGIAVDTPQGLVRPVLKNADQKSIFEIAGELSELSERARNSSLRLTDIEGGCISITSLGNIGGTSFTPIVVPSEVAVLGISRIFVKPAWDGERFVPRRSLPLDLSYDHRVINGADAARFLVHFCRLLGDPTKLSL